VTNNLSAVCVFCGSSPGAAPEFVDVARRFGALVARRGLALVYGGGKVGLMGAVADAALAEGGQVRGVITRALEARELAHLGLSDLRIVETMHQRKAAMADMADAFVMLPGGYGTWEEFMEVLTWAQLGIHEKPCGILDVDGFFAPLVDLIDTAVRQRFVRAEHRDMVVISTEPGDLIDGLAAWEPVRVDKWLDRSER